jgi:hypothetical protein
LITSKPSATLLIMAKNKTNRLIQLNLLKVKRKKLNKGSVMPFILKMAILIFL